MAFCADAQIIRDLTLSLCCCHLLQVTGSYICAMEAKATPSVVALSRQNCVHLEGSSPEAVAKGAYTLCEHGPGSAPDVILAGTGEHIINLFFLVFSAIVSCDLSWFEGYLVAYFACVVFFLISGQ